MSQILDDLWRRLTAAQIAGVLNLYVAPGWHANGPAAASGPCPRGERHGATISLGRIDGPPMVACACRPGRPTSVLDVVERCIGRATVGVLLEAAGLLPPGVTPVAPSAPDAKRGRGKAPFVLIRGRPPASPTPSQSGAA